jgi:phosphatidylserine/phosphatidylglycerophosphate/cardiolipin synthase-like enzyme
MMKNRMAVLLLLCASIVAAPAFSPRCVGQEIELIETVPVGTILDNADIRDAAVVWPEMIGRAKRTLDIEQFYICDKKGEPMEPVIYAVLAAAKRGVHVRVVVDAKMYKTYPETVDMLGKQKNIESRTIDYGKVAGGIQHSKFFIVDGQEVFFGSQNFDWRALKHIHELGFRIRQKDAAQFYSAIFDADWQLAGGAAVSDLRWNTSLFAAPERIIRQKKDTVVFFPTCSPITVIPDSAHWDELNIIRMLDGARKEVVMQFLSFSPEARRKGDTFLFAEAIRRTAGRGVAVKIIVSDWQKDTRAEKFLKEFSEIPNVEMKYSAIPDWEGGYISFGRVEHCKYIIADGQDFWLGTSNAERGYFYETRNLGVMIHSRSLAQRLNKIFYKSWDGPYTEPLKANMTYTKRKHDGE